MTRRTVAERAEIATNKREAALLNKLEQGKKRYPTLVIEYSLTDLMCEYERGWIAGYRAARLRRHQ